MEKQAAIDRARDKAKVFKIQAQIQTKLRKQQSLASNYSEQSSKRSSRHSKTSKLSTFFKEFDRRLDLSFCEIKKNHEPREPREENHEKYRSFLGR